MLAGLPENAVESLPLQGAILDEDGEFPGLAGLIEGGEAETLLVDTDDVLVADKGGDVRGLGSLVRGTPDDELIAGLRWRRRETGQIMDAVLLAVPWAGG